MEYFVEILFKNAKAFQKNNRNTKDKSYSFIDGILDRKLDVRYYDEPITVHHISNMLHVLFGKRPVPSLRKSIMKRDERLYQMANESYLRIDAPKIYSGKSEDLKHDYIHEFIMTKKSQWNSWKNDVKPNWYLLKRFYVDRWDDYYTKLCSLFNDGDLINKYSVVEIIEKSKEFEKDFIINHFGDEFKRNGNAGVNMLFGGDHGVLFRNVGGNNLGYANLNGVERYKNLSGSILIRMSKNDLDVLNENSKLPTILDGGYVKINNIEPVGYIGDDYRKVSTIPTNTKIFTINKK